ncbi:MAG: endo-1,4-beta-xylanase [Chthonomonas sp.]
MNQPSPADTAVAYANPVFEQYFADPFVFGRPGEWCAVGTAPAESGWAFPVLRSPDLVYWTPSGYALRVPKSAEAMAFWAPEVVEREGIWWMLYSAGQADGGHRLRIARSEQPTGPFEDRGPLTPDSCPFAIDGHAYRHTDGEWYVYYATDIVEGPRPGTCVVVARWPEPMRLEGPPHVVARASADWQRYQRDRDIYGGRHDWHTLEGPCVVHKDGRIYVLYSGGNWQNESYGVDFVVGDHPMGDYSAGATSGPRVLKTVPDRVIGPGHNSVVRLADRWVIVYHAWDAERTARLMRLDPLLWSEDGPRADGPSWEPKTLR